MMCRGQLADHQGPVLLVAGDSPLLQAESVPTLLENFYRGQSVLSLGDGRKVSSDGLRQDRSGRARRVYWNRRRKGCH